MPNPAGWLRGGYGLAQDAAAPPRLAWPPRLSAKRSPRHHRRDAELLPRGRASKRVELAACAASGWRVRTTNCRLRPSLAAQERYNPGFLGAWTLRICKRLHAFLGLLCVLVEPTSCCSAWSDHEEHLLQPPCGRWADAWLSGRDRSVVSAERILRRIRALQEGERQPDSLEDAERSGLRELRDLVATLPTGIASAVTSAAADVAGRSQESQAALDATGAMIKSYKYSAAPRPSRPRLSRCRARPVYARSTAGFAAARLVLLNRFGG